MLQHLIEEGAKQSQVEIGLKLNRAIFSNDAEEAALYFAIWLYSNNLKLSMDALQAIMFHSSVKVEL